MTRATAAVLAGGKSSRMKTDKALLDFGGQTMIQRIVTELKPYFDRVLVAANDVARFRDLSLEVVPDIIPGYGPLSGIHAALCSAQTHLTFVVACDMPFVDGALARDLVELTGDFDCAAPIVHNYVEPLYAVYARTCIKPIEMCISEGRLKVIDLFSRVRVKYIKEAELPNIDLTRVFFNINYPRDWANARAMAGKQEHSPRRGFEALPPFICVTGTSDAGKTMLLTRLVAELRRRGLRIGTVKHAAHGADLGDEGKDSWRHYRAGADIAVVSAPEKLLLARRLDRELPLEEVLAYFRGVDLVLVEGYKRLAYPKILLNAGDPGQVNTAGLVAVVGPPVEGCEVPSFGGDDVSGLADEILRYFGLGEGYVKEG